MKTLFVSLIGTVVVIGLATVLQHVAVRASTNPKRKS
jgi:hypothetical protein